MTCFKYGPSNDRYALSFEHFRWRVWWVAYCFFFALPVLEILPPELSFEIVFFNVLDVSVRKQTHFWVDMSVLKHVQKNKLAHVCAFMIYLDFICTILCNVFFIYNFFFKLRRVFRHWKNLSEETSLEMAPRILCHIVE